MTLLLQAIAWMSVVGAAGFVVYMAGLAVRQAYRETRWRIARKRINRIHAEMRGAAARRAIQ